MTAHLECQALTNKWPELVLVIQHSLESISDLCRAKGLVGDDTYSAILEQDNSTSAHKSRLLLANISSNISLDPRHFEEFTDILEGIQSCSELAHGLREELKDLQDRAMTSQLQDSTHGNATLSGAIMHGNGTQGDLSGADKPQNIAAFERITTPYSSGPEVVDLCIEKLKSPVFNMPDETDFMRRVAYVMSDFGREVKGTGGIWQLSMTAFEDTMDTRAHYRLPPKYKKIWKAFGIDWTLVKYDDLNKPFYSALAARLYLSNFPEYIPHQVSEQAEYWKFKYMRGKGDMQKFTEKVLKLLLG